MMQSKSTLIIAVASLAFSLIPAQTQAASAAEIDVRVDEALRDLYKTSSAAKELGDRAQGILVFPRVIKAGLGVGGEYGEGALRIGGNSVEYYATASASVGFQLGAQAKAQVIMFMTPDVLEKFRKSTGWEVGVDGSVAVASIGAGGDIDTKTLKSPIIGFVFSNKGLMYNLTLEGSKITKLKR